MATKLEIWNATLIRCGAEPVASLVETNKRSVLLQNQYNITLREVLNDTTWNFATRRVTLLRGAAPLYEYNATFTLTDDIIRVLDLKSCGPKFKVEERALLTNVEDAVTDLQARCIVVVDESNFTASFTKALVLKLAEDISYGLVQSAALQQAIVAEAERYLRRARSYNSQEGTPAERYPEGYTWSERL